MLWPSLIRFSFQPSCAYVRYAYKKYALGSVFQIWNHEQGKLSKSVKVGRELVASNLHAADNRCYVECFKLSKLNKILNPPQSLDLIVLLQIEMMHSQR